MKIFINLKFLILYYHLGRAKTLSYCFIVDCISYLGTLSLKLILKNDEFIGSKKYLFNIYMLSCFDLSV